MIFIIATYDVIVSQFISLDVREKYLLGSFGWSWQTWIIILLSLLLLTFIMDRIIYKKDTDSAKAIHYENSPTAGRDHVGDIVYGNKVSQKKEVQKREANFRLDPCRRDIDTIGITVFNDEDVDFTEKSAELLGFAKVKEDGNLYNMIDILGNERRVLGWFEKENKIVPSGHSLIEVAVVDWQGIHFSSMIVEHNTDEAIWKVGIEIKGKLNDFPIIPKICCLTFVVRKNILKDNREIWVVGLPTLDIGDCNWVKTISGLELEQYLEKKQEKKWWMSRGEESL